MAKAEDDDKKKWPKNLYKRGDSWIVDFICRGHRYNENIGPVTRTQAKLKRDTMKGDAAAARLDIGPRIEDLTFDKAVETYLEWYKANRKPNSYIRHNCSAKHLKTFFGDKQLSLISTFLVDSYKLKRKAAGAKHATVNRELAMLKNLFNKAIGWKFAKTNPCIGVANFKEDNSRNRYLTDDEARKLLSHCSGNLRLLVTIAMYTGFRASELRSLRWSHVDFRNVSVTVDSAYSKNGETRSVPMAPDLEAALCAEYERRQKPAQDEAVLLSNDGTPWKDWRSAYKLALEKAGITNFTFHDLRHHADSPIMPTGVEPRLADDGWR